MFDLNSSAKGRRTPARATRRSSFFAGLGRFVVTHPWRIIAAWVAASILLTMAASPGGLVNPASVQSNSTTGILPAHDESAQAAQISARAFPQPKGATAVLVVTRADGHPLTRADSTRVSQLTERLTTAQIPNLVSVSTGPTSISPNHKVQLATVVLTKSDSDPSVPKTITTMRTDTRRWLAGSGLTARYGGDAAVAADNAKGQAIATAAMIAVILILLLVIFRSPVIAFLNLLVIGTAGGLANALLVLAAKAFGFHIDDTVTGLLPVVAFGVGTDYVVFLIYRYRERLRKGEAPRDAMAASIAKVGEAITSSAFAVMVSLAALLLSSLGSFRVLGPALAGTVLLMLAVGLTFVPAVLVVTGRRVFWPAKSWQADRPNRTFDRVGRAVSRRPAQMAMLATGLLAVLALAAGGYHADYNQNQASGSTESAQAVTAMTAGFPLGTLYPTHVVVKSADGHRIATTSLDGLRGRLADTPGVGQVLAPQWGPGGDVVLINVLLKANPFSQTAMNAVQHNVIPAAHGAAPAGTIVRVGGDTSAYVDVKAAVNHDMLVIFPVAGLLIGLILALMLRSLIAPLFVMGSVVLGFGATLGASVLTFQGAGGDPGLQFTIPIVVYLFVASMGSDYAILMISRLREELADGSTTRDAARLAVRQSGPAVTSAGLILAGSFAALMASPSLAQIGFAVAIGVILVSFVMALVLIPSLTTLFGRGAFWPGNRGTTPRRTPAAVSPAIPEALLVTEH